MIGPVTDSQVQDKSILFNLTVTIASDYTGDNSQITIKNLFIDDIEIYGLGNSYSMPIKQKRAENIFTYSYLNLNSSDTTPYIYYDLKEGDTVNITSVPTTSDTASFSFSDNTSTGFNKQLNRRQ